MTVEEKIKLLKNPSKLKEYIDNNNDLIFKENRFELVEYALVNGYTESFKILFLHFYPEILCLFKFGFYRDFCSILEYDEDARKHRDYLRCLVPPELKNKIEFVN
jgi:hypothetical protein